MALDTTIGGSSSDSYVTVAELNEYIEAAYGDVTAADFLDLEESAKEHRLRLAALLLNTIPYRGAQACFNQRLAFPRWWRTDDEYEYVMDNEEHYPTYDDIPDDRAPTIPTEVKYAQMEICYQVVDHIMSMEPLAFPEQTIRSFELGGSLAIEFFGGQSNPAFSKAKLSSLTIVYAYLGKWRRTISGGVV